MFGKSVKAATSSWYENRKSPLTPPLTSNVNSSLYSNSNVLPIFVTVRLATPEKSPAKSVKISSAVAVEAAAYVPVVVAPPSILNLIS